MFSTFFLKLQRYIKDIYIQRLHKIKIIKLKMESTCPSFTHVQTYFLHVRPVDLSRHWPDSLMFHLICDNQSTVTDTVS